MSDQNRGAYTPQSEAPLAFDARHSRGPGDRPAPYTLLASAGVLVLVVVVLAVFFMRGARNEDAAAPAPIDAMKTPAAVAEAKPAARTGLQVYADGEPLPDRPAFTAPPEAPGSRPAPSTTTVLAPPVKPAVTTTVTTTAPVKPAATTAPAVKPVIQPVVAEPSTRADTPPPPTSTAQVQIGAFSSSALADDGWNDVARLLPGQMAGKNKRLEPVERDGSTLYRASVTGFASRQEAAAFCEALKSRGHACLVRN